MLTEVKIFDRIWLTNFVTNYTDCFKGHKSLLITVTFSECFNWICFWNRW